MGRVLNLVRYMRPQNDDVGQETTVKMKSLIPLASVLMAGWFPCTDLAAPPVFDFDREFYPYYLGAP